jgi:hypothetical protein
VHRIPIDRRDPAVPPHADAAFRDPVLQVGQDPRLDLLVERGTEVRQRDARTGTPEFQRCFGRRVAAADDHDVLLERLVSLAKGMRDVRQVLTRTPNRFGDPQ